MKKLSRVPFWSLFGALKKKSSDHLGWETPGSIPFMVTNYPRIELSTTAFTALRFIRSLCFRLLFKGIVLQSAIMSCDIVY